MNLELYGDKILLRPLDNPVESATIIIPDGNEKPGVKYAEVVAVGCGVRNDDGILIENMSVPGQTVMHNVQLPLEVEHDGEIYHLVAESSLLGVLS